MRIVQLTDPHLGESPQFVLAGVNTLRSFSAVMAELKLAEPQPRLLVVTGDIAADGDAVAYRQFSASMTAANLPYSWVPGNHDDFSIMQGELTAQPFRSVVELDGWRLVHLISSVDGQVSGALDQQQLDVLRMAVEADDALPIAVFMHHPPSAVGSQWLDKQRVANNGQLAELLADNNKVKAVFTGHVHQESESDWNGTPVYTTPSTCIQFARKSREFSLCEQGPGYRWIDLHQDGCLETGVAYLSGHQQAVDKACTGY